MPCNSDYLEPNSREKELQRTAKLLVYVCRQLHITPDSWIIEQAKNIYASDDRVVPMLCTKLKSMSPLLKEQVIYNAHDPIARDLANWYETHETADREREKRESAEARKQQLRQQALTKLSAEEIKALGI